MPYDFYEEQISKEDNERLENEGLSPEKVKADIENVIANIYRNTGRKPTRGEVLVALLNDYGYTRDQVDETISNSMRGML